MDIHERFWAKVIKHDGDGCWLWTGGTAGLWGHGQFAITHTIRWPAHRFAFVSTHGPIHRKVQIDHRPTCPKRCVRPDHLRVATNKQNGENRSRPNKNSRSGIRGVFWYAPYSKWVVQVGHNRRIHHGGYYTNLADAEAAAISLRNKLFTHNDLDRSGHVGLGEAQPA